jgi:hypothetical protein
VSAEADDLAQQIQVAANRSILAMAYHYSGDFDRAIELNYKTISEYQSIVKANPGDHSTQSLIVGQRFKLAELQMLSDRWGDARQTITRLASELSELEGNQQLEGFVATFRTMLNLSEEILSKLEGATPATDTQTGDCMALLWVARRDAGNSNSFILSDPAQNSIRSISPEFSGSTFQELFDFLYQLDDIDPSRSLIRPIFEARVFGILAARFLASELSNNRQLADQSLQRCLKAIEQVSAAMPDALVDIVLNDPDLIPIRETEEFATFWHRVLQRPDQNQSTDSMDN